LKAPDTEKTKQLDRAAGEQRAPKAAWLGLRQLRRFLGRLGPGLVTGAADDDPSGISTYSVTGAAFGYAPLWTVLVSFPLMVAVQLRCARVGLVTGDGLAAVDPAPVPNGGPVDGPCALGNR
jgi:hypothetical protein